MSIPQEINRATQSFVDQLEERDQMAVLCILTHGDMNYLYGSDGERVAVTTLLDHLSNQRCPAMAGKPKLVLIQACRNGESCVHLLFSMYREFHTGICRSIPRD